MKYGMPDTGYGLPAIIILSFARQGFTQIRPSPDPARKGGSTDRRPGTRIQSIRNNLRKHTR